YALGLRNPGGMAFDPRTGTCFVIDAGDLMQDEIDEVTAGANFGWPAALGPNGSSRGFVDPAWSSGTSTLAVAGAVFLPGPDRGERRSPYPEATSESVRIRGSRGQRIEHAQREVVAVHGRDGCARSERLEKHRRSGQRVGLSGRDETVRAGRGRRADRSRHRIDRTSDLARLVGGDERAGIDRRLDDYGQISEAGDGRISLCKGPHLRRSVRRKLRNERSARTDRMRQSSAPAARVREIRRDAGAEHRDRAPMRGERAFVRRPVDSLRESGD